MMQNAGSIHGAADWRRHEAGGAGPFTSRVRWRLSGKGEAVWESRRARKRGEIGLPMDAERQGRAARGSAALDRRLRRINWVASGAFITGGSLFALGAIVAQLGSGNASTAASIYLVGGVFFTTGAYTSLLGAINAPRSIDASGGLVAEQWRWWSYEPGRIDWLSTFVLFLGTLAFGVSLVNSFIEGARHARRQPPDLEARGCRLCAVPALRASGDG